MTAVLLVVVAVAAALFGAGLDELAHYVAGRTTSGNFPPPVSASTSSLTVVKRVPIGTLFRRATFRQLGGRFRRRTARRVKARFVHTGRHVARTAAS